MQDILWKQIIEQLFPDFVAFFLPEMAEQVDFSQPYAFLDKELEAIFENEKAAPESSLRRVDKLAKVCLQGGQEQWVLIHAEIQGYHDQSFERRMFSYFARIFERYEQKLAVIAVFTDERKGWKPSQFNYEFAQTCLNYSYPVYKILDQDEKALKADNNPFAQVVLAGLYALQSKHKGDGFKLRFKSLLTDLLFKKGYEGSKIKAVYLFLDRLIQIEDVLLRQQYRQEVKQMAMTHDQIRIIGDFEKVSMEEGRQEEKCQTARKMLAEGFEDGLIAKLTGLSLEEIQALKTQA